MLIKATKNIIPLSRLFLLSALVYTFRVHNTISPSSWAWITDLFQIQWYNTCYTVTQLKQKGIPQSSCCIPSKNHYQKGYHQSKQHPRNCTGYLSEMWLKPPQPDRIYIWPLSSLAWLEQIDSSLQITHNSPSQNNEVPYCTQFFTTPSRDPALAPAVRNILVDITWHKTLPGTEKADKFTSSTVNCFCSSALSNTLSPRVF